MNTIINSSQNETVTSRTLKEGLQTFATYLSEAPPLATKGNRISRILYRATGKNSNKNNAFLEIPSLQWSEVAENLDALQDHILNFLEGKQDEIIKEFHKSGSISISPVTISLQAVIASLESNTETARISGDLIKEWFDSVIAEKLTELFSAKLGVTSESSESELEKLLLVIETYKEMFAKLASGKVKFTKEEAEKLLKALQLSLTEEEIAKDNLASRFSARLEKMAKAENDLLPSL